MRLRERWNGFWFAPAPLLDLAVARVVLVGFQLVYLARSDQLLLLRRASEHPEGQYAPLPVLRLLTLPFGPGFRPSFEALQTVQQLTMACGVLALVGLATHASLGLFALGNLFLQAFLYSFGRFHHPEALMMIALGVLTLSPSGRVLALDALRARSRAALSPFAGWPLRVMQCVFVLAYTSAAWSKLLKAGPDWMNGYTLQYYVFIKATELDHGLGLWLARQHNLARALSWLVVLFEGSFFLVLVYPRLRWIYLPFGVLVHATIHMTMGAPFYQFVALYVVFVPWRYRLRERPPP